MHFAAHHSTNIDPYLPKIRIPIHEYNPRQADDGLSFTEEQIAQMSRTILDTNRAVRYIKQRWPVDRLDSFCIEIIADPIAIKIWCL
jgi:hypothetical protein